MNSPVDGRFGIWLRQYGDTSERSTPNIIARLKEYGFDMICLKVADGLNWQGVNDDTNATPIWSLDDIAKLKAWYEGAGIKFVPVVVPRGRNVEAEAEMHAQIAEKCGVLMTDIEPYKQFWDGSHYSNIPIYAKILREMAPTAYLINQPDPREWAVTDGRVAECGPYFDGISAQHYVGWAGVEWINVHAEIDRLAELSKYYKDVHLTLYGVDRIDLAGEFYKRAIAEFSIKSVHVFTMGPMGGRELSYFRDLPRPNPAPVEPPAPPQPRQRWINPVPGSWVSTPFNANHPAIDLAAPIDTPVIAPADGVVVAWRQAAKNTGGMSVWGKPIARDDKGFEWLWDSYGSFVIINHDGELSLHGHTAPFVQVGDTVRQGAVIGHIDNTGKSDGPHVHLEWRAYPDIGTRLDPNIPLLRPDTTPLPEPEPQPEQPALNPLVVDLAIVAEGLEDIGNRGLIQADGLRKVIKRIENNEYNS